MMEFEIVILIGILLVSIYLAFRIYKLRKDE